MARTLAHSVRTVRRDAILDVAEQLIRTRGYEQMSIQDVQDELGVSRGAIYHYFDSKSSMLEAVIDRMVDAGVAIIEPIAADPELPPATKLQAVFATAGRWKTERSDLLLGLLRSWYSDENDVVRLRVARAGAARITPILAEIVREGTADGSMSPTSPEHAAAILMALLNGSADSIAQLALDRQDDLISFDEVERFMAAYDEAVERILGLPAGTFCMVDPDSLRVWFG